MLTYIARRFFQLVAILLGVSLVVFLMLRLIPGDPALLLLGEYASPKELEAMRHKLGLDRSLVTQYWIYLRSVAQGDLGTSIRTGAPVLGEIGVRLIATAELSFAAMAIATFFGISAGVISAVRQYSFWDYTVMFLALLSVSMPIFWLGLMLIYLLAVKYPLFPMMGRLPLGLDVPTVTGLVLLDALLTIRPEVFWSGFRHLVLPAVTLATIPTAVVARITRSSMLEVLNKD